MLALDVHQHLWPEEVVTLLEGREAAPRARWSDRAWELELPGEPAFRVSPGDHDPVARTAELPAAGVDRALVALSSPAGVETLPPGEAVAALAAWTHAAAALPPALGWWAAVPATVPVADQVALLRDALTAGATGLCLDATRLSTPVAVDGALGLLAELGAADAPLFVHPGPVAGDPRLPAWWAPATAYVAQMHAAWHALRAVARPVLPGLRIVHALLAGLAPVHAERTLARGGPADDPLEDPWTFYETSSYGPRAVRAMAAAVGPDQLVHGSDRPVVAPRDDAVALALGPPAARRARRETAARALGPREEIV